MYDVAVIGAGVVGAMVARELTRYGACVCILEKENDVAMGATKANSAIVHAGFDAKTGTLKAKLNVAGSKMMKKVTDELGVKYKNNGSLVIGFGDEDKAVLTELLARGNANGVAGLELLDADELHKKEPNISANATCALYAPTGAIVCPYELCIAAVGNAMDNGAELKTGFEVDKIEKKDGFYVLSSGDDCVEARFVVNAAGVYSDKVAKMAGDDSFSISPRRGEYILLDKDCGSLVKCTVFRTPVKKGKGILVSPTVDGNLLVGPTAEDIEDKEDKSTTAAGLSKVISEGTENLVSLPVGKTITSFCGLRSVGDTGDFIINIKDGFVNAAGIESPGLSASPAIAEYVAELLFEDGLEKRENKNFNPVRKPSHAFREASAEEKNRIIKEKPEYGRMICRCENVTEGEIIEAIHTNPCARDVDGVKRRTRAGMGRCQGGFCLPSVMEILSRELGVPYEGITKCGGSSDFIMSKTKGIK